MIHDKSGILHLAQLMLRRNIRHVVISPGSRNAPLVAVFGNEKAFETFTVVDERSAAFFALGMAQQLNNAVALVCTSGTAVLNYAPAVAEAYYQRIPLVVITADRPAEWIDQGDGQTIHQLNIFGPHVRKSVNLPQTISKPDDLWYNDRLISEALNAALEPVHGPVHINVPLGEPLYGFSMQDNLKIHDISDVEVFRVPAKAQLTKLKTVWENAPRKMILAGQMSPDIKIKDCLNKLAQRPDVVVLTETTSNCFNSGYTECIDRSLAVMQEASDYYPDLLITFGGPVVSKRIKAFLRKAAPAVHWNVDLADSRMDTYQSLTHAIAVSPADFLPLLELFPVVSSHYSAKWSELNARGKQLHETFLSQASWSDLKIFELIIKTLPSDYLVQLGNSTPVRYAQLFDSGWAVRFDSNRGTSGIDGSLSTAVGAALASKKPTLLITGDLSFFYDSNGMWNKHLPANLKIIVINNRGGGIFRFIEGPDQSGLLQDFFEARHQDSAVNLASAFGLSCFNAEDPESFKMVFNTFLEEKNRAALLEINSLPEVSGQTIRQYFDFLRKGLD